MRWVVAVVAVALTGSYNRRPYPGDGSADRRALAADSRARVAESSERHWRAVAVAAVVDHANAEVAAQAKGNIVRQPSLEHAVVTLRSDSVDVQFGAIVYRVPGGLATILSRLQRVNGEKVTALLAARDTIAADAEARIRAGRPPLRP